MRILIASKFFYSRGGAEVVAIGTKRMLEQRGHDVRVFAMAYPDNIRLPEDKGFARRVSFEGNFLHKLRGAMRTLGYGDVVKAARRILDDFNPDVVHLHNVHSYLSPIIGELAHKRGIRVVWTLHDYKLICPAYAFRRPDGVICQECLSAKGSLLRHRCMKGSVAGSLLADLESKVWNRKRLENFTDTFITPSRFMGDKMKEGGFSSGKVTTLCNFVDPPKLDSLKTLPIRERGEGYFCYIGRLSEEKGVPTLLRAAKQAGVRVKVAGDGPLMSALCAEYGSDGQIEFKGKLNAEGVAHMLNGADAMVISSEWYENNPLSVIESLCAGTPVIGAEIGGIPELITTSNGVLYPSGDSGALTEILKHFSSSLYDRKAIAEKARIDFCEDTHYDNLMRIYCD